MIFAENTIVDSSHISGHYAVYGDITIGHCKVSGILHQGTYAANALITSSVSGPMKHPHVLPEQVPNHMHTKSHSVPGVVESTSNHIMADLLDTNSGESATPNINHGDFDMECTVRVEDDALSQFKVFSITGGK